MNIFIRPTAGGEAKRVTTEKDRDIRSYAWKGNKFLVYAMDDKGDENFHLKRVDLKSGEVKDLTPFPKVRSEIIDDLQDVSETDMLITLNKRNPEIFDAFRINVATGEMKMVAENPGKSSNWITDHAGVIRAATRDRWSERHSADPTGREDAVQEGADDQFSRASQPAVLHLR